MLTGHTNSTQNGAFAMKYALLDSIPTLFVLKRKLLLENRIYWEINRKRFDHFHRNLLCDRTKLNDKIFNEILIVFRKLLITSKLKL